MISSRDVLDLERRLQQEPDEVTLREMLLVGADGMAAAKETNTGLYNRLHGVMHAILERLTAPDPKARYRALMDHPHPYVYYFASAQYFHTFDREEAKAHAEALAKAVPADSPLGRQVDHALWAWSWVERSADGPPPSAELPGSETFSLPQEEVPVDVLDAARFAEIAEQAGVAEHLATFLAMTWPSVRLIRTWRPKDDATVGTSKLGGSPDLPPEALWPCFGAEPLAFLAQLDLAAMAEHHATNLPSAGLLSFFYEAGGQPWHGDPAACRVLFSPPGTPLGRREAPEELDPKLRFRTADLAFRSELTWPCLTLDPTPEDPDSALGPEVDELDYEALDAFETALIDAGPGGPLHRVGGYCDDIQSPGYHGEEDWRLLLQLDSDELDDDGMFWGAGGRLYFWIRRADLLAACFDRVEYTLECT